ncbi:hypothetical protein ACLESO_26300, partial [Pyxidicoccus sp. 3LG]
RGECRANCDCPSGSVCTNGTCRTPTPPPAQDAGTSPVCRANCECPSGNVCTDGLCKPVNQGSGNACVANCECPAGERCIDNVCWL